MTRTWLNTYRHLQNQGFSPSQAEAAIDSCRSLGHYTDSKVDFTYLAQGDLFQF